VTAAAEKNFMMLPAQKFCEAETYKKCCIFLGMWEKGRPKSGWRGAVGRLGVQQASALQQKYAGTNEWQVELQAEGGGHKAKHQLGANVHD